MPNISRYVAFDTETERIGPGKVIPPLVCYTLAEMNKRTGRIDTSLIAHCDPGAEEVLTELFQPGNGVMIVTLYGAYDLCVISLAFPNLEPLVWAKVEAKEVTDVIYREKLLNLSTHGKLEMLKNEDGTTSRIGYSMADLVKQYYNVDLSEEKKGDDTWRMNFHVLVNIPSSQYPADAAAYAKGDAWYTLGIHDHQADRVLSQNDYASLGTDWFHTMVSYALLWITSEGMGVDKARFVKTERTLAESLSDENMLLLIENGLITASKPRLPWKAHENKAAEMLAGWLNISPDDIDWASTQTEWIATLEEAGIKFKDAESQKENKARIVHRIVAAKLAPVMDEPIEVYHDTDTETLLAIADQMDVKLKLTEKGDVCADKEVVMSLDHDEVLVKLQERRLTNKLLTRDFPHMRWNGEPADRVHFGFGALVETGRTNSFASSNYPSDNGQAIDPRVRPMYVAKERRSKPYVLCSSDYSMLELVCVAHVTKKQFEKSVHYDKINAGIDLHAYFGTSLAGMLSPEFQEICRKNGILTPDHVGNIDQAYPIFKALDVEGTEEAEIYKLFRKLAKPFGLGGPSGIGPRKMVEIARKAPYFVDIEDIAEKRWVSHPQDFLCFGPEGAFRDQILRHAKKLHRMRGEEDFDWTKQLKGVALAMLIYDRWKSTYPEMIRWFAWVKEQVDPNNVILHEKYVDDDGEEHDIKGMCYTSELGMHRAGTTYTAVSNGRSMQTPGGEGFKQAVFDLVRACRDKTRGSILYGTAFVVNEIHDEIIAELKQDEFTHERAMEMKRIMEQGMAKHLNSGIKITVDPVLMHCWDKRAKQNFGPDGRLIAWDPTAADAAKEARLGTGFGSGKSNKQRRGA